MRIVLFSDSHNNFDALNRVVRTQSTADAFLHLGDGWRELEDLRCLYPDKLIFGVRGNCDWGCDAPAQDLLVLGGKRIFCTHGHMYGVKSDLERLMQIARGHRAHIAAFGHSHVPLCRYEDGLYLINPGSVSHPRSGRPSYGVIDLPENGEIVLNTVYL